MTFNVFGGTLNPAQPQPLVDPLLLVHFAVLLDFLVFLSIFFSNLRHVSSGTGHLLFFPLQHPPLVDGLPGAFSYPSFLFCSRRLPITVSAVWLITSLIVSHSSSISVAHSKASNLFWNSMLYLECTSLSFSFITL